MAIHRPSRIEAGNPAKDWREWKEQSELLFGKWKEEVAEHGLRGSNTATVIATTPWGVRSICSHLPLQELKDGDVVIEIGAGPGPMPQAILRRVRQDIRYIVIELNPEYIRHLEETVNDDRLVLVNGNARDIQSLVEEDRANVKIVLSSMPFSHDTALTLDILHDCRNNILALDGTLAVWNFTKTSINLVKRVFGSEHCQTSWAVNTPPLRIIRAKMPIKKILARSKSAAQQRSMRIG